jgi:hypothetical protein
MAEDKKFFFSLISGAINIDELFSSKSSNNFISIFHNHYT